MFFFVISVLVPRLTFANSWKLLRMLVCSLCEDHIDVIWPWNWVNLELKGRLQEASVSFWCFSWSSYRAQRQQDAGRERWRFFHLVTYCLLLPSRRGFSCLKLWPKGEVESKSTSTLSYPLFSGILRAHIISVLSCGTLREFQMQSLRPNCTCVGTGTQAHPSFFCPLSIWIGAMIIMPVGKVQPASKYSRMWWASGPQMSLSMV